MSRYDFTTYLSPFTWRYGSTQMRQIWSEIYKRKLWRKIWVALARAQVEEGLISKKELDDLIAHKDAIDIEKSHTIEREIRHDLMAEIKVYASQAKVGGGKIHLGATSMDIEDNADALRCKESLHLIEEKVRELLKELTEKIKTYKDVPCMGYTHLQPAEPTTIGYRFAFYTQDMLLDLALLQFTKKHLLGKGIKGAVGTAASYVQLLTEKKAETLEKKVMEELGITAATIASQTGPRKIEYFVGVTLTSIAQSLYKFAFDLRIMQSPGFYEWQEPFGKMQVGSSAMPFKRNPIKSEQICSLARLVFSLGNVSRDNAANMLLERTLDDSANRRVFLPEMFLAVDEMLQSTTAIVNGLVINDGQVAKNLAIHGPFAAVESVLMAAVKNGANRQEMHEILRDLSMEAWSRVQKQSKNPLRELVGRDKRVMKFLNAKDLENLFDPTKHLGLATVFCDKIIKEIDV